MKTLKKIMTLVILTLVFASCKNETTPEVVTVETTETVSTEVAVAELDPNAKYAKAELVDQVIFPIDMDKEIHYRSDTTR